MRKARQYKKKTCHKTKSAANKKAKSMRSNNETASVRKSADGWCVWSAGKSRRKKRK